MSRSKGWLALTAAAAMALMPLVALPEVAAAQTVNLCQTPVDLTTGATRQATINRFEVGNHENESPAYDRVVIGLNRPAAVDQVRYVPQIIQVGSGLPIVLRGNADLEVRVAGAVAHNDQGQSTLPVTNYNRDWASLRQARLVSDFEGVTVFGVGVNQRVDFQVFTLTGPDRLVIDLAKPGQHPWNCSSGAVKVYFFNQPRYLANTEPFYTPVWRRVATPAVAGGALGSLFHGLLATEYQQGLRFLNSDATGFTALSISGGIARVRLTDGCSSHGSTETIAGEIFPTLKQFPTVQYVKIYDPSGHTEHPLGSSDSIPECLEP